MKLSLKHAVLIAAVALLLVLKCQALPQFEHEGHFLSNNSYIYSRDIDDGLYALNCVTDSVNCCNNTDVGGWRDESGRPVYQGADGVTCLYVTRGDGEISLNRKRGCTDHTSGLVVTEMVVFPLFSLNAARDLWVESNKGHSILFLVSVN